MNKELVWVARAQQGNDEAFTRLVEAYQRPVYNLCYRMLGEPEAAEDAAQETFLRAYQHLDRYDPQRPFATWLLSIAAHYCIDHRRRRKFSITSIDRDGEERSFQSPDAGVPNPKSELMNNEQSRQIQGLLKHFSALDRAAIVMHYWQDFSDAEIAHSLNLSAAAVKSRLHRARHAMAVLWQGQIPRPKYERRLDELQAV